MFKVISYEDTPRQLINFSEYTDKIVKIYVNKKSDEKQYELFLDALMRANPYDVKISENLGKMTFDGDIVDQTEDTITLLDKYVG